MTTVVALVRILELLNVNDNWLAFIDSDTHPCIDRYTVP